ncbi:MAG: stage II sporulation protein M [Verrucomicrobiota bacterium]
MTISQFVQSRQPRWKRLEELLGRIERRRLNKLDRKTLQEFGGLYRACSSDLAFAQTYYAGTTLTQFLHQLVGRAHHQIYRTEPVSPLGAWNFFRRDVPQAIRGNLDTLTTSLVFFLLAFSLGVAAGRADPRIASLVVPEPILESIYAGQMWTDGLFTVVPASVSSALIFTNNISVAFMCFVGGMTFGFLTVAILVLNGFLIGIVFALCAEHGMLGDLLGFVASHGMVEISTIIVAGSAGLLLARALLNPGNLSRADALTVRGKQAVSIALGCVPPLVAVGLVEGFISPAQAVPDWAKIMLGLVLLVAYWTYVFRSGR